MPQNRRDVRMSQTLSRRPYEAPRLQTIHLRREEQLLSCLKEVSTPPLRSAP
jgi:hypothetical protein